MAALRELRSAMIGRLRRLIGALTRRSRLPRVVARWIVRLLLAVSLPALRASPWVKAVFLRGSQARGDAVPLVSDVDLAIIVREESEGPSWEASVAVLKRLRRAALFNPLIRDSWQLIAGDTEWRLFQQFWFLFQLDEWKDEQGRKPSFAASPIDARLAMAASWNRQHMWTDIAVRHILSPFAGGLRRASAFAAAEKKALQHANRLRPELAPPERQLPPSGHLLKRGAALLTSLDDSAAAISSRLNFPELAQRWWAGTVEVGSSPILAAISRYFDVSKLFSAILRNPPRVLLVTQRRLSISELSSLLDRLSALSQTLQVQFFVYSPLTLSLAPIIDEIHVLDAQPCGPLGIRLDEPLLLREQLFFEAVYLGAELRVLADRPVRGREPPLLTFKLARSLLYFTIGKIIRDRAAAVEQVGNLYPGVGRLINEGVSTRQGWFRVNSILFQELVGELDRLAMSEWPSQYQ